MWSTSSYNLLLYMLWQITTALGRGRALIRICLSEQCFAECIQHALNDKKRTKWDHVITMLYCVKFNQSGNGIILEQYYWTASCLQDYCWLSMTYQMLSLTFMTIVTLMIIGHHFNGKDPSCGWDQSCYYQVVKLVITV